MNNDFILHNPEICHLTTVEIFYHMPDHPSLLQAFIWQDYDYIPDFPMLQKFLDFWEKNFYSTYTLQIVSRRDTASVE